MQSKTEVFDFIYTPVITTDDRGERTLLIPIIVSHSPFNGRIVYGGLLKRTMNDALPAAEFPAFELLMQNTVLEYLDKTDYIALATEQVRRALNPLILYCLTHNLKANIVWVGDANLSKPSAKFFSPIIHNCINIMRQSKVPFLVDFFGFSGADKNIPEYLNYECENLKFDEKIIPFFKNLGLNITKKYKKAYIGESIFIGSTSGKYHMHIKNLLKNAVTIEVSPIVEFLESCAHFNFIPKPTRLPSNATDCSKGDKTSFDSLKTPIESLSDLEEKKQNSSGKKSQALILDDAPEDEKISIDLNLSKKNLTEEEKAGVRLRIPRSHTSILPALRNGIFRSASEDNSKGGDSFKPKDNRIHTEYEGYKEEKYKEGEYNDKNEEEKLDIDHIYKFQ